jgi:hypothetical protein
MKVTFGVNSYDGYRDPFNTFIPEPILTVDLTWSTYVRILRYVASVPRLPCEKETDTKWSAPMILGNAGHRRADNIIGMSAFVGGDLDAPGWTMERLRGKLAGLRCVVHTTTHSRPEHQKFRIIVALDREHGVPEYPAVWGYLNHLLDDALDIKTRNIGRILYFPGQWEGADNQFASFPGEPLAVATCLAWQESLPKPAQAIHFRSLAWKPPGP